MSTAKFDTLQNAAGSKSVPVATVVDGSAKAWVNFNGTGTVAIRAAFNVTSITDAGVGTYVVNFTTAMPDANYSAVAQFNTGAGGNILDVNTYAAGSVAIQTRTGTGAVGSDSATVSVAIFR